MKKILFALASTFIAGASYAKTCDVAIEGSDSMVYNKKTIEATGCTELKITLKHSGKLPKAAMGHNIVITSEADMKKTIDAAMKSGPAKDYAAEGALAATKLLGGGESDTITVSTSKFKKGTKYKFYCTFPGHSALMNGDIKL